jgi:hypothetical protein
METSKLDTHTVYAKRAYEAFIKGSQAEELAYVAGAWRSRNNPEWPADDPGMCRVWIGVAEAARAPASIEFVNDTQKAQLELVRMKTGTREGLIKLAEYTGNYLNDMRIDAIHRDEGGVRINIPVLNMVVLVLQSISAMSEITEVDKAAGRLLPCGCVGVVRRSIDAEKHQYIAKIVEYCEHHQEHWYRGYVVTDEYLERKVDRELIEQLAVALSDALRGEPYVQRGFHRAVPIASPAEIDALFEKSR